MISTMTVVIIMSIALIWLLIYSNSSNKKEEKKKRSKYKIEVSENGNWYIYRPMSLDYRWWYSYFTKVSEKSTKEKQEFDNEKDAVCFINNLIREDREFKEKEQKLKDMTIYIDD